MKKYKIAVGAILLAGTSMTFSSCIGSFAMTNKVLSWNKQVGNKFVNELVFFAFWILPVYEVTSIADLLVINTIEFWSGNNPMSASTKAVDTDHGRYLIATERVIPSHISLPARRPDWNSSRKAVHGHSRRAKGNLYLL